MEDSAVLTALIAACDLSDLESTVFVAWLQRHRDHGWPSDLEAKFEGHAATSPSVMQQNGEDHRGPSLDVGRNGSGGSCCDNYGVDDKYHEDDCERDPVEDHEDSKQPRRLAPGQRDEATANGNDASEEFAEDHSQSPAEPAVATSDQGGSGGTGGGAARVRKFYTACTTLRARASRDGAARVTGEVPKASLFEALEECGAWLRVDQEGEAEAWVLARNKARPLVKRANAPAAGQPVAKAVKVAPPSVAAKAAAKAAAAAAAKSASVPRLVSSGRHFWRCLVAGRARDAPRRSGGTVGELSKGDVIKAVAILGDWVQVANVWSTSSGSSSSDGGAGGSVGSGAAGGTGGAWLLFRSKEGQALAQAAGDQAAAGAAWADQMAARQAAERSQAAESQAPHAQAEAPATLKSAGAAPTTPAAGSVTGATDSISAIGATVATGVSSNGGGEGGSGGDEKSSGGNSSGGASLVSDFPTKPLSDEEAELCMLLEGFGKGPLADMVSGMVAGPVESPVERAKALFKEAPLSSTAPLSSSASAASPYTSTTPPLAPPLAPPATATPARPLIPRRSQTPRTSTSGSVGSLDGLAIKPNASPVAGRPVILRPGTAAARSAGRGPLLRALQHAGDPAPATSVAASRAATPVTPPVTSGAPAAAAAAAAPPLSGDAPFGGHTLALPPPSTLAPPTAAMAPSAARVVRPAALSTARPSLGKGPAALRAAAVPLQRRSGFALAEGAAPVAARLRSAGEAVAAEAAADAAAAARAAKEAASPTGWLRQPVLRASAAPAAEIGEIGVVAEAESGEEEEPEEDEEEVAAANSQSSDEELYARHGAGSRLGTTPGGGGGSGNGLAWGEKLPGAWGGGLSGAWGSAANGQANGAPRGTSLDLGLIHGHVIHH